MGRVQGRVAIVTGGTAGIGRATALLLAREGARVVVAGRRAPEGEAVAQEILALGGDAVFVRADVTREEDCASLVQAAKARFGALHLAFNNAGVSGRQRPLPQEDEATFDAVMAANVKSVLFGLKHQIPAIQASGGGAIVNNASVAGLNGAPMLSIYGASKHAVVGLTKSAAMETATTGPRINAVCPGAVRTEMLAGIFKNPEIERHISRAHPMGRVAEPEEIAAAVLFLLSDEASFITGQAYAVDGGLTSL